MKRFYAVALFTLSMFACNADGQLDFDKIAADNAAPTKDDAMGSPVTPGDYGGSLPVNSIQCPNDNNDVVAADLRAAVAALLANDTFVQNDRETWLSGFHEDGAPPLYVVGSIPTFSGNTWTDTDIIVDALDMVAGDDFEIDLDGTWNRNTATNVFCIGMMRIVVVEDVGGANTLVVLPGVATISEIAANAQTMQQYNLHRAHRLGTSGRTKFKAQIRSMDLSGGAGTATIILQISATMQVKRIRRNP